MEYLFVLVFTLVGVPVIVAVARANARKEQQKREQVDWVMHILGQRVDIGNKALFNRDSVVMAVSKQADCILIAELTSEMPTVYEFAENQILGVELVDDVRVTGGTVGAILPIGDDMSSLITGSNASQQYRGSWLKILTNDVSHPWIVLHTTSAQVANDWSGILKIVAGTKGNSDAA